MADGINSFFWALVVAALNSMIRLIGETLLTTPTLEQLPRVGELWESSRGIAVATYALVVLVAGIVLMAYETPQTRTTIRRVAPRIAVGFLAANLSLLLAGKAIEFANALSYGLLSVGVDPSGAAQSLSALLSNTVLNAVSGAGFFGTLISLGIVVLLISLVGTYIVRVAVTVVLLAGAGLFLVCHRLELTDGIARWWRAFAGMLGIQLCQSLALIAALRVFLAEGGFTIFGPTSDGVINLIATGGLLWILVKIASWVMHHIQLGGGGPVPSASPGPCRQGRQLALPFKDGWPENCPVLGHDGQYRLPLDVERVKPAPPVTPVTASSAGPRRSGRQLTLQFDPFAGNRPTRPGQYPLPLNGVHRVKAPKAVPEPPSPAPRRSGQLRLPLDLPKPTRPAPPRLPKPGGEKS